MYDCGRCCVLNTCACSLDPMILCPAIIFSGGELLATFAVRFIPQGRLVHVHSHAYYVRVSSFSTMFQLQPCICCILEVQVEKDDDFISSLTGCLKPYESIDSTGNRVLPLEKVLLLERKICIFFCSLECEGIMQVF